MFYVRGPGLPNHSKARRSHDQVLRLRADNAEDAAAWVGAIIGATEVMKNQFML
jgi:hypothetical protein